ncbi:spermatogenesis-associated protein 4 isoform X1 [Centrocercus urophasianus]|uniref:spermatogenesis-associated protein 4 isoform X1 n=1 Tax=Centrocercus urophasianus TaxID=9002 RepID=UPI001C64E119|nr:spermatogenesis-associated protein 4 isoform X1 [Centrocercus urophasianus]
MALRQPELPRPVLRWLLSLGLSVSPRNYRRDFSNGYLVAEILSRRFPAHVRPDAYTNGCSLATKLSNWSHLRRFLAKQQLDITQELIDGTIHCKPGAAESLLRELCCALTSSRIGSLQEMQIDFTDCCYQTQLPVAIRATASTAIKSNIRLTEMLVEPSICINRQKAITIINMHIGMRMQERAENPRRFNIKPSFGQRVVHHLDCIIPSTNTASIPKQHLLPHIHQKPETKYVHSKELRGKQLTTPPSR